MGRSSTSSVAISIVIASILLLGDAAESNVHEDSNPSSSGSSITAVDDSVRWQGRTLRCGCNKSVAWSYAGVSFAFQTRGASKVSFQTSSTFLGKKNAILHVYINGALSNNFTMPNNSPPAWYHLATGLDPQTVTNISGIYITDPITMSWNTLPTDYKQTVYGFYLNAGKVLTQPPIPPNQRRLDIYGDSITAGNQIDAITCDPDWSGPVDSIFRNQH